MIKKLLGICTTLVPLVLMNGNVALADTGSYRFTDTSSIKSDISQLGLDYTDYKLISDKNYNRTDVIALSESYIDSGNTKQIVNYVYVYNPYKMRDDVSSITLKYNESSITQKVESFTKDYLTNIVKYKVDFRMPSYSELKRRYDISALTYNDNSADKIDFGCTYNQDGSNVQLDYDSYIFITGKDLFDYCPTPFKNAYNLTDLARYSDVFENGYSCILNSNDKSEYLKISENFHWVYFGSKDLFVPEFVYLNFDTNKKIDVINEIDLSYKLYKGKDKDSVWNGCSFIKCIQEIEANDINNVTRKLVNDYSSNYLTLKNENNTFFRKSEYSDSWSDSDVSLSNFVIPAKNRLSNWSDSNFYSLLSTNAMKNSDKKYTPRQSFENRQVSILVDILPIYYSDHYVYKYVIEDLSVMRINYTTDMKVVNARCNSGALISSVNANNTPKVSFWDRFIAWFNDNFPYSLLIIGGAIIGLPIIISIVFSLFTSGSSALLSGIAKGISKLVILLVKGFVKLIVTIISLPFKLLGAILSPKKNNSNKNTSKKK